MIDENTRYAIDAETARHEIGIRCHDCNTQYVVYGITIEDLPFWDAGAYCYPCLLKRIRASGKIPLPMPTQIYDLLKLDLSPDRHKIFVVPDLKKGGKK